MSIDKSLLLQHCTEQCLQKLSQIKIALTDAQESIFNDTKSSMGDKYETSREMAQQEINRLQGQERQVQSDLKKLQSLRLIPTKNAGPGSIVGTDQLTYFIGISLGAQKIGAEHYMVISPDSPIGRRFLGKKPGDTISFNGRDISINEVR